jgi:hypothetical protein
MNARRARELNESFESIERIIGEVRQTDDGDDERCAPSSPMMRGSLMENLESLKVRSRQLETLAKNVRDDYESVRGGGCVASRSNLVGRGT